MYEISEGHPVLTVHLNAQADDITEALTEMISKAHAAVIVLAAALDSASGPPADHVVESFLHLIQRQLELAEDLASHNRAC